MGDIRNSKVSRARATYATQGPDGPDLSGCWKPFNSLRGAPSMGAAKRQECQAEHNTKSFNQRQARNQFAVEPVCAYAPRATFG